MATESTKIWREIKKSSNPFKGLIKILLEVVGSPKEHKQIRKDIKDLQAAVTALQKKK